MAAIPRPIGSLDTALLAFAEADMYQASSPARRTQLSGWIVSDGNIDLERNQALT
jgi:hypothetical protein